ncbi:diaminopimelate decarboxylase [soil metagenome]
MFDPITLKKIAGTKTPFFLYDLQLLDRTLLAVTAAATKFGIQVHYALKANWNDPVLQKIKDAGLGVDCVSGPEISKALQAGFRKEEILMAGAGKTDEEIILALETEIACLNCESLEELEVVAEIAHSRNRIAPIALRINPDVAALTHQFINTGTEDDKFGIAVSDLPEALTLIRNRPSLKLIGLHFHIGSQISEPSVFHTLCVQVNLINQWFIRQGITLPMINMGGGLAIDYSDPDQHPIADFDQHLARIRNEIKTETGQRIHIELGRSITAQCGSLIAKVLFKKKTAKKEFLILDAGMTELIRPALYGAKHKIQRLIEPEQPSTINYYEVVGPICESSDTFGTSVPLTSTSRGDLIIIRSTGAYGEVMSSQYNLREKAGVLYI